MRIGVISTGGKDSIYAAFTQSAKNELACVIGELSKDGPNEGMLALEAETMELPFIMTRGSLQDAVALAKEKYRIEAIVSGVISNVNRKKRLQEICDALKIKLITPLWDINDEIYLNDLIKNFHVVILAINAEGLDASVLGSRIGLTFIDRMKSLNVDPSGEGGEFQSYVLECPLYKQKIHIEKEEVRMFSESHGQYKVKRAILD